MFQGDQVSRILRVKDMEFFQKKIGGKREYIDVLCVQKSFCSGFGAMENPPMHPPIIDYSAQSVDLLFP